MSQPIEAPSHTETTRRQATADDPPCTCGRPAVVVFETPDHGELPWCGEIDRVGA